MHEHTRFSGLLLARVLLVYLSTLAIAYTVAERLFKGYISRFFTDVEVGRICGKEDMYC